MKKTILFLLLTVVFGSFQIVYAQKNEQLKLKINEQKTVENRKLTIKFVSVLEDSRCPEGVNCVWSGNAKIKIKLKNADAAWKTFELNTNIEKKEISFEGYVIKIAELTPTPQINPKIDENSYVVAFTVGKSNGKKHISPNQ